MVWVLEAFWFYVRPFFANGVGDLQLKTTPFGRLLSASNMGRKKEDGSPAILEGDMAWVVERNQEGNSTFENNSLLTMKWGMSPFLGG